MGNDARQLRQPHSAYAGLDFIKAAFCPLDFNALKLHEHPEFIHLKKDRALADLEVGKNLYYPRQFPFTDVNGNRKTGTQIITSPFGLAPKDFDLFLGLFTYLKRLPEIPSDGKMHLTLDFLAKQLQLPVTSAKDYQRIRSRLFRFSYVKYTNSAMWNSETKSYDLVNFGFFNLASISRLTQSRRPITLQWDATFLDRIGKTAFLSFDFGLYQTLSPTLRRFYLIANRDGWNQRESSIYLADSFTVNQIGYDEKPGLSKLRMQKLRRLLSEAEELDLIRPSKEWPGYLQPLTRGVHAGQIALRWSRGPLLRSKLTSKKQTPLSTLDSDALFDQCQFLRDENRQPMNALTYRRLLDTHGRETMQKHIAIILAQKEHRPKSFQKSEVAAFINRLQENHPEPDWYQSLTKAERLATLHDIHPNQQSLKMYETLFRK